MTKGLILDIFKSKGRDWSNGGVSSRCDEVTLVGADLAGVFEPKDERPAVVLVEGPNGSIRAVPKDLHDKGTWVQFGGTFVSTSDSRFGAYVRKMFPNSENVTAIKLFDRVEG